MIVQMLKNKEVLQDTFLLSNRYDNKSTDIKINLLDEFVNENYFYYLICKSPDKNISQFAVPLALDLETKSLTYIVRSHITNTKGNWEFCLLIKEIEIVDGVINDDGLIAISEHFVGKVKSGIITEEELGEQPMEENLQIVYDRMLAGEAAINSMEGIRITNENGRVVAETLRQEAEEQREIVKDTLQGWLNNPEQFKGEKGIQGETGKSIEYTWNGTQLGVRVEGDTTYQYINLKGEKGDKGNDGYTPVKGIDYFDGIDGKDGEQGLDGLPGQDGKDGLSAYEVWLGNGNTGTVEDYINSLKAEVDGKRIVRYVIGTSTSGWTEDDVDYLCDGTADDVEINAAITALPLSGGEIMILDGTYNITNAIEVTKDNVSIKGNGNSTVLKRMYKSTGTSAGVTARGVISLYSNNGCKISNFQIHGNREGFNAPIDNYGISLGASSNNTIARISFVKNNNSIILLVSDNNIVVENDCSNNNGSGIRLEQSSSNTIINNIFDNTLVTGAIYIGYSSDNNVIAGNSCNNNTSRSIFMRASNNNTITGNACNNSNGIYIRDSNNNTITGNSCIRGIGTPEDYTTDQHTIHLALANNNYNLISSNNCMGKAPAIEGGIGNTVINNKWKDKSDFEDLQMALDNKADTEHEHAVVDITDFPTSLPAAGGNSDTVNGLTVQTAVPLNAKFTDTIVDISGKLSKSNDTLETYTEKIQATTGIINLSLANVFTDTPSASRTYSITNAKSGVAHSFTLIITMGATVRTLTFPASVKWQGGEIPDMTTASKTYVLTFLTVNGGTAWLGMSGGEF